MSLGSPSGFINYYHTVPLWTLLHLTMVSSVDVHCKRDSPDFFSHLDVSHNELLSEISLSWARLPSIEMESGKFKQNNMASASIVCLNPNYGSGSQLLTGSQQRQKLQCLCANFMAKTKFS